MLAIMVKASTPAPIFIITEAMAKELHGVSYACLCQGAALERIIHNIWGFL
jgi:hypothetical protein